jgi:hypothetical protein
MELGGRVAYHAKAVPVKGKENNRTRKASLLANSPSCVRTGLGVRVCFYHIHKKNWRKLVS